ncbi:hypothetical protein [Leeuwenhoekiella nanhaiensis]|uniref:Uncharacterized protein n=1 Tax=Leeuwenhoekiella nanhaiensis TaxID=1655491 RepID=A0A2G1VRS5_9FLAO|nr:hypothetical protein [Leeuwenhoekiella nanhaiensis]PHQ29445.1 hypothetical protein CJ305_08990 [Leeuwenhoekiella nanhaiensis]
MRFVFLSLLFVILNSCQNDSIRGNWGKCNPDGGYWNYTLTDSILVLAVKKPNPFIEICNVTYIDEGIIISDAKQTEIKLMTNPDTLKILFISSDSLRLQSTQTGDQFELSKADFRLDPIDFNNYKSWKKESLAKFDEYAARVNCAELEEDIRSLNLDEFKEEEIKIYVRDNH